MLKVNDVVMLNKDAYYMTIDRITKYVVTETFKNHVSNTDLIKLREKDTGYLLSSSYSAKNFYVVEPFVEEVKQNDSVEIKKYLVVDSKINHIIEKFETREKAEQKIKILLNRFPRNKYHLFILASTGSIPEIPVEWEIAEYD